MALSFSKSVRFGVLRFNFSSSGIGVSAGVPGFRIGSGPRGAYISGSVAGFRYRQSLGTGKKRASRTSSSNSQEVSSEPDFQHQKNIASTQEHLTPDVMMLSDSSGDELLQSINEQAKKRQLWPAVGVALLIPYFFLLDSLRSLHELASTLALVGLICITLWVRHLDKLKKLTVLFYEVDSTIADSYAHLVQSVIDAAEIKKLRSVLATSKYKNSKYEAGAANGLKLDNASFLVGQIAGILSNIDVPILNAGKIKLAFYPDRVLAFQDGKIGAVEYADLEVDVRSSIFIETESLPADAEVVDRTWQYVNKKGGPDKRFKNNIQYPVCRYQELRLLSSKGLDVRVLGSKSDGFDVLEDRIKKINIEKTVRPKFGKQGN